MTGARLGPAETSEGQEMRISLQPDAVSQIKKIVAEHNLDGHCVRIGIGDDRAFTLDIVDDTTDRDRQFDFSGVKLVCDPRTWLFLGEETKIGFAQDQGGFTFSPPKAV